MGMTRRRFGRVAAGAAALALPCGWAAARTVPPGGAIPFTVYRDGDSRLGHHRLSLRREGEDLVVEVDIQFRVEVAFITAFRYSHRNREVWRGGRIVELETVTNDDGDRYWVRGAATPGGFAVESSTAGAFTAPPGIVTTSYWNMDIVDAAVLLDTQRGLLMDVRVDRTGEETIRAAGRDVAARRYAINILTNKPGPTERIDIWFGPDDAWAKLAFDAKGSRIDYVLDPPGEVRP